jgi:hypothetical protein
MNAAQVVDLLLELNIIGTEDIDSKLRKIAARIANPDAKAWFMRVPRYFLINLDKQAETPYTLPQRANKYLAFKEPGKMGGPPATNLHRGDVEQEIDRTFSKFDPSKPAKQSVYKGPPGKEDVTDWMKAAKGRKDQLYHYDPYNRDKFSFERLTAIADYLNTLPPDDPMFKQLRTMRFDDIEGFRSVSQAAQEWRGDIDERPWAHRKMTGYSYGNMSVISVNDVQASIEIARGTNLCTRMEGHAKGYLDDGLLYYVFIGPQLFACIHVQSNQVRDTRNQSLDDDEMHQIAPLFKYIPLNDIRGTPYGDDIPRLAAAVAALPQGVEPEQIKNTKEDAVKGPTKVKRRLPPFDDEPPRDTGYRPESLAAYVSGIKISC